MYILYWMLKLTIALPGYKISLTFYIKWWNNYIYKWKCLIKMVWKSFSFANLVTFDQIFGSTLSIFINIVKVIFFPSLGFGDRLLSEMKKLTPKDNKIRVSYILITTTLDELVLYILAFNVQSFVCLLCIRI